MSKPIRIDPSMLERAEVEGRIYRRSPPKQIEFWAEIGRQVSNLIDPKDLFAVFTGAAKFEVKHKQSRPVSAESVLAELKIARESGELQNVVTDAIARFEMDSEGRMRRVSSGGKITYGSLVDGEFVPSDERL